MVRSSMEFRVKVNLFFLPFGFRLRLLLSSAQYLNQFPDNWFKSL